MSNRLEFNIAGQGQSFTERLHGPVVGQNGGVISRMVEVGDREVILGTQHAFCIP